MTVLDRWYSRRQYLHLNYVVPVKIEVEGIFYRQHHLDKTDGSVTYRPKVTVLGQLRSKDLFIAITFASESN